MTLKSFLLSYDKEHTYTFYIGIDSDDKVFDNKETHKEIVRFLSVMKNVNVSFIYLDDAAKGHLTKMWNILFEIAYKENNDYLEIDSASKRNLAIAKEQKLRALRKHVEINRRQPQYKRYLSNLQKNLLSNLNTHKKNKNSNQNKRSSG